MRLIPSAGFMYLASPYSHPDPFMREMRYLWTMHEMTLMLQSGLAVYSPIVHCHELAKIADLPREAAFWMKYNFTMLAAAEILGVLMLPGWKESVGVTAEISKARDNLAGGSAIEIMYIEPKRSIP